MVMNERSILVKLLTSVGPYCGKAFMKSLPESSELHTETRGTDPIPQEKREVVFFELEKILASPYFRSAARSRQFLQYVVQHQLEEPAEPLKERTLGTEVFHRKPGYPTGEDPVVRVQAGEVRRRLDQYYQTEQNRGPVRIELPIGSYSPLFHWNDEDALAVEDSLPVEPVVVAAPVVTRKRAWPWRATAVVILVALAAGLVYWKFARPSFVRSEFDQFWEPIFATQQPALICLAKGVTYRPRAALYEQYARTHPGAFQNEVTRFSEPLPLDPNEKLNWSDMELLDGYGVALGDVSAAVKFSALLGKLGKTNQVRIGANYSYEDLRNSPAIVIGAFNNRWTMDMLANQHFAFIVENGDYTIREQIPGGRVWKSSYGKTGALEEDFAIVARLLDSKTGEFTVIAAGMRDSGTAAAGEFASNAKYAEQVLNSAPSGWQKKNLEVVMKTTITDSIAGPPQPVATYFW
jgi:hypothetical protein